ncbi:1-acyl-sn-glycerol-3-phosphate acyltransferase [Roseomonas sp. SSH11]|uniref:1-acyl-sn-glycerol-3-phosphate acyltransferase n=1 Tax=Pararoseomonas baculiformis TaxID=2820812 RepID=A0ABS4AHM4_9PROT|nr:lysophospholipid acyltransferase family protein [Pararoseomonas baculiformis]MBP0446537.1 1-acyl-sn-glycerol-3-phosphate acyltransferase [Pararoseomonas baculiformis]
MPTPQTAARPDDRRPLPPPDRPRSLRDTLAFYGVVAVLGAAYLGWGLVAILLSYVMPPRIGAPFGRKAIGIGFRRLLRLMEQADLVEFDLDGLDALRDARGLVVAPNHLSKIDVMLIVAHLPDTVCIMKAGLERNPAMGGGRLAGYIPNNAGLPVLRRAVEALRGGANLLVFPEGTRSPDGKVGPFHPGFALIARRARAPVQPVFIESNSPYLGKGWPIWRRPDFPLRYRIRLGEQVMVEGPAEAFAETLRRQCAEALGEARP